MFKSTNHSLYKISNYPQLPPKHGDPALGLLFAQTPLNGVEAVVGGQGDVPPADSGADGTCQDVGLSVEADAHSVGIHHSQGAVVAQLIAVPHLVCRERSTKQSLGARTTFCNQGFLELAANTSSISNGKY